MKRKSGGERGTAGESQKPAAGYHPETDTMPAQVGREAVVAMLSRVGASASKASSPVPSELVERLGIPEKLFSEDRWTFSSDPGISVKAVAEALFRGAPLNGNLPELPGYGLCVFGRGSSSLLVLVDKSRKIAVIATIMSHSGTPEWQSFLKSIDEGLERAKKLRADGTAFKVVVNNSSLTTHI
ncbi:MAG TPA: hypothetical protein VLD37_04090 [Candidatus Bilamarchaeum sp.]|nr:hypothetical protein [Candidatus Bilamarchaeum sp.]